MARFVSVDKGCYVNLDHVAVVREHKLPPMPYRGAPPGRGLSFETADGKVLGRMSFAWGVDVAEMTAPVVPAAGTEAVLIDRCHTGKRPTEADLVVDQVPVIGWRILSDGAVPLFAESTAEGAMVLLPQPDGAFLDADCARYATLDDAKADRLRILQEVWDQRHAVKVEAPE
jgi:hypothetical protein